MSENKPQAIIIGASQGIGAELAREFSARGYAVGLAARSGDRLEALRAELPGPAFVKVMDITRTDEAMAAFESLIEDMGGMHTAVINAGTGLPNRDLAWAPEKATIDLNVTGFAAMAGVAFRHFVGQGRGRLAGLSSVAALRGIPGNPAYPATKAFVSNYLECLRLNARQRKLPISVTDLRPGFVDTPLTKGQKGMFWLTPAPVAARHIADAIERGKSIAYIPPKWRLVATVLRHLPDSIYSKM